MDVEAGQDQTGQDREALAAQLAEAQERLAGLVRDLRAIDGELEGLSTERRQHQLLGAACGALEELAVIGGAELFWGDRSVASQSAPQLLRVRSLVEGFEKRIGEIEDRRQEVLDAVLRQQDDTDGLEGDVIEAEEAERRREHEWLIEREINDLPIRDLVMAWSRRTQEDSRFRKWVANTLLIMLLFAFVIPQIEIPIFEPEPAPLDLSDRTAKLMMKPKPLPVQAPVPVPQIAEQKIQEPEKTVPELAKPKEGKGKGVTEGPAQGPAKGLLAFKEQIAGVKVDQQIARLGAEARVTNAGASSGAVERSMITTSAPGSSGGINLSSLSRGVNSGGSGGGQGGIQGVAIARATSTIAGGGGGSGAKGQGGNGAIAGRTDEEIQIVFDRHKAELYRLYNRELRRDPTLRGQMILHMTILPNGSVSMCQLRSSDMNAPDLGAQVVARVKGFDFGAKEGIGPVTILYPIDFLPAG
jgi:hypothetical protein